MRYLTALSGLRYMYGLLLPTQATDLDYGIVDVINTPVPIQRVNTIFSAALVIALPVIASSRNNTLSRQTKTIAITMYLHFEKHCLTLRLPPAILSIAPFPEGLYTSNNITKFNTQPILSFT